MRWKFLAALREGDVTKASKVVDDGLQSGRSAEGIYLGILLPGLIEIGQLWSEGTVNVAQEHLATQITILQMDRLRRSYPPRPHHGRRAAVTTAQGERHSLGARAFADFLIFDGWEVDYLGEDIPTAALVSWIEQRKVELLAFSILQSECLPVLQKTLEAILELPNRPKILIGGGEFLKDASFSHSLAADYSVCADLLQGLTEARRLIGFGTSEQCLEGLLKELGRRVQRLRKTHGWSQQVLADEASLDRTYISAVEHGRQNVSLATIAKLATALGASIEWLLFGQNRKTDWVHRANSSSPAHSIT